MEWRTVGKVLAAPHLRAVVQVAIAALLLVGQRDVQACVDVVRRWFGS